MMLRYAPLAKIVCRLFRLQTRSMLVVNGLVCQNAVISRTTSAARYTRANQASGGVSRMVARAHGRRHSAAETRDHLPGGAAAPRRAGLAVTAIGYRPRRGRPGPVT